ncbi:MAG: chemotaxis protein CheW [Acidobacteriota bacterium]
MFLTFRCAGQAFAVPMSEVEEVVPASGLRSVPGLRPESGGVLVHRGRLVAAFAPGPPGSAGTEVIVLRGAPGIGLLGTGCDALTDGFLVGGSGKAVVRDGETFRLLRAGEVRERFGAVEAGGERDGQEDPARR